MKLLTQQELNNLSPGIFRTGTGFIIHPWFNDAKILYNKNGELWVPSSLQDAAQRGYKYVKVNWVAVRGNITDWAIYHSLDSNLEPDGFLDGLNHLKASPERIARAGAKLHNVAKIKEFVPSDEEVFDNYRH